MIRGCSRIMCVILKRVSTPFILFGVLRAPIPGRWTPLGMRPWWRREGPMPRRNHVTGGGGLRRELTRSGRMMTMDSDFVNNFPNFPEFQNLLNGLHSGPVHCGSSRCDCVPLCVRVLLCIRVSGLYIL